MGWGKGHAQVNAVNLVPWRALSSNVAAGNGPRGEGDSEGVVRQQLRLKATPKHPQGKGKRERNNKRKTRW